MADDLVATLHALLEAELQDPRADAVELGVQRAAEAVFAFAVDHADLERDSIVAALGGLLETPGHIADAVPASLRMFNENENLEVLTRERVLTRRNPVHPSALELARKRDLEGLRRLPGRSLRLALNAAKPLEAGPLIQAWNALPHYEREHT